MHMVVITEVLELLDANIMAQFLPIGNVQIFWEIVSDN